MLGYICIMLNCALFNISPKCYRTGTFVLFTLSSVVKNFVRLAPTSDIQKKVKQDTCLGRSNLKSNMKKPGCERGLSQTYSKQVSRRKISSKTRRQVGLADKKIGLM